MIRGYDSGRSHLLPFEATQHNKKRQTHIYIYIIYIYVRLYFCVHISGLSTAKCPAFTTSCEPALICSFASSRMHLELSSNDQWNQRSVTWDGSPSSLCLTFSLLQLGQWRSERESNSVLHVPMPFAPAPLSPLRRQAVLGKRVPDGPADHAIEGHILHGRGAL